VGGFLVGGFCFPSRKTRSRGGPSSKRGGKTRTHRELRSREKREKTKEEEDCASKEAEKEHREGRFVKPNMVGLSARSEIKNDRGARTRRKVRRRK